MQKNKGFFLFLFFLILLLAGCTQTAVVQESDDGTLVIGEVYTLASGKTLQGDVAVIGSSITIEEGATVNGDISLIGSTAAISGDVTGDIFALGGSTTLSSSAIVHGNIDQVFHELDKESGAAVMGEISTYSNPFAFRQTWTGLSAIFPYLTNPERVLSSRLIFAAIFCFLACLIVYLLPKPAQNCVRTIKNQPGTAWGVGFLVTLVVPVISIILAITICLSPIALILLVIFGLALLFGWIALAAIVGERFNHWLYLKMSSILQTLVGAILISIVVSLLSFIPCLGLILGMVASCYGLGGVVISRFGKIEDAGNKKGKHSPPKPATPPELPQKSK